MVSSPEVRQGTLPPGFLVEREVEPVGRWGQGRMVEGRVYFVLYDWLYFY